MTSSGQVLKRVDQICSNESGQDHHRHVYFIQGRAKATQAYPRELAISIRENIAAQKRIEALGITPRAIMSVESMRQAAKAGIDTCPAEALQNTGCEGMDAFDDVSAQLLDPALMIKARKSEIEYFRDMGVYEKVEVKECWNITGKAPIGV